VAVIGESMFTYANDWGARVTGFDQVYRYTDEHNMNIELIWCEFDENGYLKQILD